VLLLCRTLETQLLMAEQKLTSYRSKLAEMDEELDIESSASFDASADMLVNKQRQDAENSYLTSLVVKVRPPVQAALAVSASLTHFHPSC
jgi:hypothetical protein